MENEALAWLYGPIVMSALCSYQICGRNGRLLHFENPVQWNGTPEVSWDDHDHDLP